MIDIHSHILPGIDDGAGNKYISLEMAGVALDSGIDVMIATPHCNIPGTSGNYRTQELLDRYEELCEALYRHEMPLTLLLGAEVFGTFDLPDKILKGMIPTLHDTEYMLIEFDFGAEESAVTGILEDVRATGVRPIIAHPERYPFVQSNPFILDRYIEKGYYLQINKGSVLGQFGRNAKAVADFVLDRRMASFMATDAHSVRSKSASMAESADYISKAFSPRYANEILFENPRRLIEKERIPHPIIRK